MAKPRPFTVYYSDSTMGHCQSLANAITAATRKIMHHEACRRASIVYEDVHVADVDCLLLELNITWNRRGKKLLFV